MAKNKIKVPSELCTYADLQSLPLMPPSRRRALDASEAGKFPQYHRLYGPYSEPVFKRQEVMEWLRGNFGKLLPDVVREIEISGELVPFPQPKVRRPQIERVFRKEGAK